jgi:hypothetical protein
MFCCLVVLLSCCSLAPLSCLHPRLTVVVLEATHPIPPHYGHTTLICNKQARCGFYTKNYLTMQHYCEIYKARKGCEHVTYVNYIGGHAANDKKCNEWQVVLQKQHRNRIKTNQQNSPDPLN